MNYLFRDVRLHCGEESLKLAVEVFSLLKLRVQTGFFSLPWRFQRRFL